MKKYIFIILSLFFSFFYANSQSLTIRYSGSWPEKLNTKVIFWNIFEGHVLTEFSDRSKEINIPDSIQIATLLIQTFDGEQMIFEKRIIWEKEPLILLMKAKDYTVTTSWEKGGINPVYESYRKEREASLKRLYTFQDICLYYGDKESEFYQKVVKEREAIIDSIYQIEDLYQKKFGNSQAISYLNALKLSIPDYRDDRKDQVNGMLKDYFKAYKPLDIAILNSPVYKEKLEEFINLSLESAMVEEDYDEKIIMDWLDLYFYQIIDDESLVAATGEVMRNKMHRVTLDNVQKHIDVNYLAQCQASESDGLKKRLAQYEKLAIGKDAPSFTWKDETGKVNKLSDYNADYYVIIFWASWCGHCGQILPKIYDYLIQDNRVMTLAIGLDEDKSKWDFARSKYPKWHHYQAVEQWSNPIAEDYAVYATPTIYVLNKDLKIEGKARNIKELENILK